MDWEKPPSLAAQTVDSDRGGKKPTTSTSFYELVKPVKLRDQDRETNKSMRLMRGGYDERPRERKEWYAMTIVFGVVLVLVTLSLAVGLYFWIEHRQSVPADTADLTYRTLSATCQSVHDVGRMGDCIFESVLHPEKCSGSVCHLITYALTKDSTTGVLRFVRSSVHSKVSNLNKAHCGVDKWCMGGQCRKTGGDYDDEQLRQWKKPIIFESDNGTWIDDGQSPCLLVDNTEESKLNWKLIRDGEKCSDTCADKAAAASIKIQLRRCDSRDDPATRKRKNSCIGEPLTIVKCRNCSDYDPVNGAKNYRATVCGSDMGDDVFKGKCYFRCADRNYHLMPDGAWCKENGTISAATPISTTITGCCFHGYCYPSTECK